MARALVLTPLALLAACAAEEPSKPAKPANVLLIVVDTLRADHVLDKDGVEDRVRTPRLDELAADGVAFERAYAHTSWTLPSHTALFSSRPPHETGVTLNGQAVPADLPLLADWLQAQGYKTRAVHSLISLQPARPGEDLSRGFESFDRRLTMGYATAPVVTEQVVPVLAELAAAEKPFFLFLHYSDPHEPYHGFEAADVPGELLLNGEVIARQASIAKPEALYARARLRPGANRLDYRTAGVIVPQVAQVTGPAGVVPIEIGRDASGAFFGVVENPGDAELEVEVAFFGHEATSVDETRRRYVQEVEHLDPWLGAVCDELKRLKLYDDTLVVLTSDHGESLGEHGMLTHGLSVFDEVLHVPLVVKPPLGHPARPALAARRSELARHVDLVPTMLSLLDLPALPGQTGVSLIDGADAERLLAAEMHFPLEPSQYALFDGRFKLLWSPELDRCALFDLASDPDELHDVYGQSGDDFAAWRERLLEMARRLEQTDVGAPAPTPDDVAVELAAVGYAAHH